MTQDTQTLDGEGMKCEICKEDYNDSVWRYCPWCHKIDWDGLPDRLKTRFPKVVK